MCILCLTIYNTSKFSVFMKFLSTFSSLLFLPFLLYNQILCATVQSALNRLNAREWVPPPYIFEHKSSRPFLTLNHSTGIIERHSKDSYSGCIRNIKTFCSNALHQMEETKRAPTKSQIPISLFDFLFGGDSTKT